MTVVKIRESSVDDVPLITKIYSNEVLTGLASFEEVPPDLCEMAKRRKDVIALGLPFLVATLEESAIGYAYASPFRPRPAYRYTVESSVYVAHEGRGFGVGSALLAELANRLTKVGRRQIIAVIGDSANLASIRLHEKAGFQHVGVLRSVGFKLGQWVDTVTMQKALVDAVPAHLATQETL